MSDAWFADKLAPDGDPTDGCHPEEVQALRAYLEGRLPAAEAAQSMKRPVATSPDPQGDLPRLYALLMDALLELPPPPATTTATTTTTTTDPPLLLDLLGAIEALPPADLTRVAKPNQPAHGPLWRGLPGFGHFWADGVAADRLRLRSGHDTAEDDDGLVARCVRQAEIEAWLVRRGLAGLDLAWGFECVAGALERRGTASDAGAGAAAVPMACAWLSIAGARFRDGAERRERCWALERDEENPWPGEDRSAMSPERWDFWIRRLRSIADDDTVSPRVRDAARRCVNGLQEGDTAGSGGDGTVHT